MKLTWFGHSCFLLEGSKSVLIDPFFASGSVPVDPDLVAVTHGHADHIGETMNLKKKTIAINEIAKYLAQKGLDTVAMNIGGSIIEDGIGFTMTPAIHSSWLEQEGFGFYGGLAAGYVIAMDGIKIYHAGDTALFSDMQLIRDLYRPDVALLPVGGRYTMGPDEAMVAAQYIGAKLVIPMHYNTWPIIEQDMLPFKHAVERTTGMAVLVLSPGEGIELNPEEFSR
ncbi:MAG: metal-dependent hydrolase [Methanomicrobiaceae archaeon]|nr:metal-dependent hydrolase [Methanomicrobiaceae archaeon]MDD5418514.1 metal-dependent hydrolase [Methanomicrobiaceae archaeon]